MPCALSALALLLILTWPLRAAEPTTPDTGLKAKLETMFSTFLQRELTMEKLRWRFPARYTGTNLKLWEAPGVLMAEAPKVVMKVSLLKSAISRRFRVSEIYGRKGRLTVRYWHNGQTNLTRMVKDIVTHSRANRVPGRRQKAVYNLFKVRDWRMNVVDAETGNRPFATPFRLNGTGDIDGLGPKTQFEYHLDAVQTSTVTPTRVTMDGVISRQPRHRAVAARVPLQMVEFYLPVLRQFTGEANAEFHMSKTGAYRFWKLIFSSDEIRLIRPRPFPVMNVTGFFHAFAPSYLKIALIGNPTRIDTVIRVSNLQSKRVSLHVQSKDGHIAECIEWCRTGIVLAKGSNAKAPVVWDITGQAEIEAKLTSVMGPDLLRKADGQIDLKLRHGAVAEIPGLTKSFKLLNLASILINKTAGGRGLQFGSVHGTIDINDGVAETRGLILLEGNVLDLGFMGRINFPRQSINARLLVGVVNVPEAMIKRIPGVRRFEDGRRRGVVPLWLAIQGPLADPNIRILPIKEFQRDLWKSLPAPLRLPESEIQKLYR